MSGTCTPEILQRFTESVHLILRTHRTNSSMEYGNLKEAIVDALSIDLYNGRGYVRLDVPAKNNIILEALKDDVKKCYATTYYHEEKFMEGPVIDMHMLRWSESKSILQVDIDLTKTEKEWEES